MEYKLGKEIRHLIILKLLGLFCLWYFFFSHPIRHELNTQTVAEHYLGSNITASALSSAPRQKNQGVPNNANR